MNNVVDDTTHNTKRTKTKTMTIVTKTINIPNNQKVNNDDDT
jgi:hypothetical protein